VAGLFPPQEQAWGLDAHAPLTPQALARVCRESAQLSFDQAAQAVNEDWGTRYDGKQLQRWSEHVGEEVVAEREAERRAHGRGKCPEVTGGEGNLLVIGMDGGRMQSRVPNRETGTRWMEDKVATLSRYHKGDSAEEDPKRLSTTYVGTLSKSRKFGAMVHVEAERCGLRQTPEVLVIGDGAAWIDTLAEAHFPAYPRIVDYYHAAERLCDCAKALRPAQPEALAKRLKSHLYLGRRKRLLNWLGKQAKRLGRVRPSDPPNHPRRVLAENITYFQRHQLQMDYPQYRANGWPIGSGVTESGVKLFNKRVKGTEQF
jgi:hypothetical protein